MSTRKRLVTAIIFFACASMSVQAQAAACTRPGAGGTLLDPVNLFSSNGTLQVNLSLNNSTDTAGNVLYCYISSDGSEAPTLHVNPGDTLIINLTNALTVTAPVTGDMGHMHDTAAGNSAAAGACVGGTMTI